MNDYTFYQVFGIVQIFSTLFSLESWIIIYRHWQGKIVLSMAKEKCMFLKWLVTYDVFLNIKK